MRSIIFAAFLGVLVFSGKAAAQQILQTPASPRVTSYKIRAELDPDAKTVRGEMEIDWRNPSRDTVSEIQFHLYLNAFKNKSTVLSRGRRVNLADSLDYGYTDVEQIRAQGQDLTGQLRFIQPDEPDVDEGLRLPDEKPLPPDLYTRDQTVAVLGLPQPVMPDSSVRLKVRFTSKLPKIRARTGFSGDYFFVAQWFPKTGVYEPAGMRHRTTGGWNTHQFHPNSEFYANHSLYQVDVTMPEQYVAGSGGKVMAEKVEDGKRTISWRAEDIVDFAWTASKDYEEAEGQWKHVKIRFLSQPEHLYQADRHIQAAKYALEYLETHVGPYPWDHLTIVDPPTYGQGAAGMEYTTMITAGTFYLLPEQIRMPEMVTVHEFGHAYFMGILANNEFEDPWLDEGINSYWESRIMDWAYGEKTSMFGFPFLHAGDVEYQRISWLQSYRPDMVPSSGNSWSFPRGTYGAGVYQKPATMLNTLERMIGQETMDRIFRTYYERWAFRHPDSRDFIRVVNETVAAVHGKRFGDNLNWFFDQFLFGTAGVDYAVRSVISRPVSRKGGWYDANGAKTFIAPDSDPGLYQSVVQLERLLDGIIPVEVEVRFDNGETIRETWDGKNLVHDLTYEKHARVISARIDPDQTILLDRNLLNNSFSVSPPKLPAIKWAAKFMFLIGNLIHSLSIFS